MDKIETEAAMENIIETAHRLKELLADFLNMPEPKIHHVQSPTGDIDIEEGLATLYYAVLGFEVWKGAWK